MVRQKDRKKNMRSIGLRHATVLGLVVLTILAAGAAKAQVPNEPAEINACVCLRLASGALAADKDAKSQALTAANQELADLDAQLASARARIDVNNPDSVASYKALLQRRDAAFGQISPAQSAAAAAVARYNTTVDEHNRRCAGQPFNSDLLAQIQAHPNCPPLQ
jgi:nitrate/nitrite-specific signal transduction histidine kinase